MFGEGKFPLAKVEEVCEYITKGTTPKSNEIIDEFGEGFVPYLKVYNLSFDGSMLFEDKPQYVTLETHNKLLARSKVYPNDVLMNIVGPPLGKFAIVPNIFSEWNINQAIAIFRATNKINPLYLLHSLKQPRVLKPFIDSAVGVRQQNLSLLQCRNLEIPLPPIEKQNQFADFIKQIDKLKFEIQNSINIIIKADFHAKFKKS
ncbi:restriction endonuclease subunit S [Clostridium sp. UBA1652]|uniref:restriction endonuclease subunit S n=1 Tax=Clostridium sp. UBA1652 TaxID=1946348 RepID=UPI00257F4AB8|nr:restriction endonuclease subunit S [Clostridium sp. UBA1652]